MLPSTPSIKLRNATTSSPENTDTLCCFNTGILSRAWSGSFPDFNCWQASTRVSNWRALSRDVGAEGVSEGPGADRPGARRARRSGVVSFAMRGLQPHEFAKDLGQHGGGGRAGHHWAQPLMRRVGVSATARASFYVYSDGADVDALCNALVSAQALFATAS